MVFAGIPFLFFFLPLALLAGLLARGKARCAALFAVSLVFYAFGEPLYVLLMVFVAVTAWAFGLMTKRFRPRLMLVLNCCVSVGLLLYFKYTDFLISAVNSVSGARLPLLRIALPIGISFYTFQSISYVADVVKGRIPPERNFLVFAAYLTFFPQLIAGPIVRFEDVRAQMISGRVTWKGASDGALRFAVGLGKKVLIANLLAELAKDGAAGSSVLMLWMTAVGSALMIYFDFSGYSDMAIGLGRMFGVDLPENFRHPFASTSVGEFWRRWHITLGSWFRDYIYIPLGGSRCSPAKQIRNLCVVWALTGLWHGADWVFVLWGLYFAVFLVLERFVPRLAKLPRPLAHLYVVLATLVSFVLFNAESAGAFFAQLAGMFGFAGLPLWDAGTAWLLTQYGAVLALAAVGAFPVVPWALDKARAWRCAGTLSAALRPAATLLLLLACTAFLAAGSFSPFLYFRF